jgi:hypothetical protein
MEDAEAEGIGAPGSFADVVGIAVDPLPLLGEPEASAANPTDIGFWRNTEYTFFKNVSPTTQNGPVPVFPSEISKMAPMQSELPSCKAPRFISCVLIGHAWPPNERAILTSVVQGNWKNPSPPCSLTALAPGTAAQMAATPSEGPPIAVVPVSIALTASSLLSVTVFPCAVTADRDNCQNVGVEESTRSWNSMSPVNNDELVPPNVNVPPGSSDSLVERSNWNAISGAVSLLLEARACQKGTALVSARPSKARPISPETSPSIRPWSRASTVRKV